MDSDEDISYLTPDPPILSPHLHVKHQETFDKSKEGPPRVASKAKSDDWEYSWKLPPPPALLPMCWAQQPRPGEDRMEHAPVTLIDIQSGSMLSTE